MLGDMQPHSIYIHIPFCRQRCLYCDFNTYAGRQADIPAYVDAVCREISLVASLAECRVPVHTVYFGGGTPSLLSGMDFQKILGTLRGCFNLDKLAEISIEANPGTVDPQSLARLFELGVNRLSLGAQSALAQELSLLGRIHTVDEIRRAYEDARQAGFDIINLDFMYGLPGQTTKDWQSSLDLAIGLKPEHLSCYALTLEEGTPLARHIQSGALPEIDDDQAADCYEMTLDQLAAAGYGQYEISNWALTRESRLLSCRHNLQYWHNDPYLGFGAGAHGYSQGVRTANVAGIDEYLKRMASLERPDFPLSPANESRISISEKERRQDALMLGLRLTNEGIARSQYLSKYDIDFYSEQQSQIDLLVEKELLEWVDGLPEQLRLTRRGRFLGNQVFMEFVGE
jgi:oxygen-independent coproporphyrinogen-3 oxidase